MNKKILVIGDGCYDIYAYCHCDRLSPEKPVPVLEVDSKEPKPGMAMNTYWNVKSIHKNVDIITNKNWTEVLKTRYVDTKSNHMFMRVDTKQPIDPIGKEIDKISEYDTIIISDYNKGFLSEDAIEYICSNHSQVFLDTKKPLDVWAMNALYIKINNIEYERSKEFIDKHLKQKVIQTKGGKGCVYNSKIYFVERQEIIDVSGAGDSFMAALCVKYTETEDIEQAIEFANIKASEVVSKRGTSLIS